MATSPTSLAHVPGELLKVLYQPVSLSPQWYGLIIVMVASFLATGILAYKLLAQISAKWWIAVVISVVALTSGMYFLKDKGVEAPESIPQRGPVKTKAGLGTTAEGIAELEATLKDEVSDDLSGRWTGSLSEGVSSLDPTLTFDAREVPEFEFTLERSGQGYSMSVSDRPVTLYAKQGFFASQDGGVRLQPQGKDSVDGAIRRGEWDFRFQAVRTSR